MTEAAQSDNALVRRDDSAAATKKKPEPLVYDAESKNRLAFEVTEGDKRYDTAHVFNALTDARYMQWQREFHIKGNDDNMTEEAREASVKLWNELIDHVEKIQVPEGTDFRDLISPMEKIESLNSFLRVAIGQDIEKVDGDRILGEQTTVTVPTECFFNGGISSQQHQMKPVSIEWQKKYSRIQGKRFKQEKIGGLRGTPKVEFVPQDDKIGELYDEMQLSATGFTGDVIPLRFKTIVIHHMFGEKLNEKKLQQ